MGLSNIHRVVYEKYVKTKEPPYTERYVQWCGRSVDKNNYLPPTRLIVRRQVKACLYFRGVR